ncbi:hypothetical protein [Planomonospora algeriensis]
MTRPYYIDDPLVDRAAHRPGMELEPVASARAGRDQYIGTCSCGQMHPTLPWDDYAVLEAFDWHMGDVQEQAHRAARAACRERNGGHRWVLECEPGEAPSLRCADPACSDATDDLPADWGDLLTGDLLAYGVPVLVENSRHYAPVAVSIPVTLEIEHDVRPAGPHGPAEVRSVFIHLTNRPQEQQ